MDNSELKYIAKSITILKGLLHDWSDEVPTEEVHFPAKHKVVGNWFQSWLGRLQVLDYKGYISPKFSKKFMDFLENYRDRKIAAYEAYKSSESLRTQETGFLSFRTQEADILKANEIIEEAIDSLELRLRQGRQKNDIK